jgi:TPP-dependent pyruvate/acetoin dehydrogenase alpha subunit
MSAPLALYRTMLRIRMVEEAIARLYPEREMRSPTHLYAGQEGVAAGVCAVLGRADALVAYYRSHGWYLAKGGDLDGLMAEMYGRATGCSGGWGGSMHLMDLEAGVMGTSAIVGGGLAHGVGTALADRMAGESTVSVVAFGDGAVEEGVFHECLNFASLRRLPVVFVCENNGWAAFAPLAARQPHGEIYRRAAGYAMPGEVVDGNDALAVRDAARWAVERARAGAGPTLLECRTARWFEHCGIGDDVALGLRDAAELARWRARCPIAALRPRIGDAADAAMRREIADEIAAAVARARYAPWPVPTWRLAAHEV